MPQLNAFDVMFQNYGGDQFNEKAISKYSIDEKCR
jgi:hypothetical protein